MSTEEVTTLLQETAKRLMIKDEKSQESTDAAEGAKEEEYVKENPQNVRYLIPKPGHVIKTTNGEKKKCFINICTSELLEKPRTWNRHWEIPHTVSFGRKGTDGEGKECVVYDCIFHPNTYYLSSRNDTFKHMLHKLAISAIEERNGVTLEKENIRQLKMNHKGDVASYGMNWTQTAGPSALGPYLLLEMNAPDTEKSKDEQRKTKSDVEDEGDESESVDATSWPDQISPQPGSCTAPRAPPPSPQKYE